MNGNKVESRIVARIVALLWAGALCAAMPNVCLADNVDVNIGEIEQFTVTDATFRVNYPQSLYLQGFVCSDDSIQLNWSQGVKASLAGEVTIGSADSIGGPALFSAWGYYAGGGGGTGSGVATTWDAGYNKGSGLSAVVVGYGIDNQVSLGSNGGQLVISLADGPSGTQSVQLTIVIGSDIVGCPSGTSLDGPNGSATVNLTGFAPGVFLIQINCAGQQVFAAGEVAVLHQVVVNTVTVQFLNCTPNGWAVARGIQGPDNREGIQMRHETETWPVVRGGDKLTCYTQANDDDPTLTTDKQEVAPGGKSW